MARLLTTGFELGEAIEHNGSLVGTLTNSLDTGVVRTGTYSWKVTAAALASGNEKAFTQTVTGSPSELYARVAIYLDTSSGSDSQPQMIMAFFDQTNCHVAIGIQPADNLIRIYRGGTDEMGQSSPTELAVGTVVLAELRWYVIECYVDIANAGGTVTVKVNGVTDATFSGDTAASANEYVDVFKVGTNGAGLGVGRNFYFDDVALNDTTGSQQNGWIGMGGVYLLMPDGAGNTTDWTPSAGDNYAAVDEIPDDASSTYVYSSTSTDKELYSLDDLPALANSISLIEVIWQAALSESGSGDIRAVIRHSGTDYADAVTETITNVASNYALLKGSPVYEVLGSSGAWTPAQVNALEAGFEIP